MTEPKPLPGGKSYGATQLNGTRFGLVTVSRSDGALLAGAPGTIELAASTVDPAHLTPIPTGRELMLFAGGGRAAAWVDAPAVFLLQFCVMSVACRAADTC